MYSTKPVAATAALLALLASLCSPLTSQAQGGSAPLAPSGAASTLAKSAPFSLSPSASVTSPVTATPASLGDGATADALSHGRPLDMYIGMSGGTLGIGIQVSKLLFQHLALRAGFNAYNLGSISGELTGIDWRDGTVKQMNEPLLLDLFPWHKSGFRLSGGVIFNQGTLNAIAVPDATGHITINDHPYTPEELGGNLTGHADYPNVCPYAGLGWGTPRRRNGAVTFLFDVGAMFGTPTVSLDAPNTATNPTLAADVAAHRERLQNDFNNHASVFPVVTLGIGFRF